MINAAPRNTRTLPGEKDSECLTATARKMEEKRKCIVLKTLVLTPPPAGEAEGCPLAFPGSLETCTTPAKEEDETLAPTPQDLVIPPNAQSRGRDDAGTTGPVGAHGSPLEVPSSYTLAKCGDGLS